MGLRAVKQGAAGGGEAEGRDPALSRTVAGIIAGVRDRGETALLEFTAKFDQLSLDTALVGRGAVEAARRGIPEETLGYLRFAHRRIRAFAERQRDCLKPLHYESDIPGVELGHKLVPVERAGCYVPAGRHPLPSSALMSITTAKAAGVPFVAACSPPSPGTGGIDPAVLAAMDIAGADAVYCMGGAQAIAAFAYGAGAVGKVDMIAGPGNRYVTEAKRQVLGDVGIDSLAGPSEVLIIADGTANPRWLAMDLLAQAEHDPDARTILVSTSERIAGETLAAVEEFLEDLPSRETARASWSRNGSAWIAGSLEEAVEFSDKIAPEHLELQIDPLAEREVAAKLKHYGSLFVGHYAPVAFGDFVSGTNHILPTMSTARFSSGLWVGSFLKTAFHQFISPQGYAGLAEGAAHFAGLEGLAAHRESVRIRGSGVASSRKG